MELDSAIDKIDATMSELSSRNVHLEELLALAVRRLVNEPFEVLAKGLNPSRFDSWSKGARSKVARQFGSSSDLVAEVLRRAISPDRGDLAGSLAIAGDVIAAGEPYQSTARAFALAFYDNLARDDGFHLQMAAWFAASNRQALSDELKTLYELLEDRIALGILAILDASGRRMRDGLTAHEQASMLLAVAEGAVIQGKIRGEVVRSRFADYLVFLLENGSEPIECESP